MGKAPKKHSAELKFRVVPESIRRSSVAGVARENGIHPNRLTKWRKEVLDHGAQIFERSASKQHEGLRRQMRRLQQLVGKKEGEIDVLKAKYRHLRERIEEIIGRNPGYGDCNCGGQSANPREARCIVCLRSSGSGRIYCSASRRADACRWWSLM